jgi:hypothetical protein
MIAMDLLGGDLATKDAADGALVLRRATPAELDCTTNDAEANGILRSWMMMIVVVVSRSRRARVPTATFQQPDFIPYTSCSLVVLCGVHYQQ